MIEIDLDRLFATLPQRSDANEPKNPELWARCLAEAKQKFRVHPSAYSNSWAAKRYKELGGKWRTDDLREWHKEKWKAVNSSGAIVGECGSGKTKGKPKCLPEDKARSLSKEERAKLAKRKQKKDPDKARSGKPIMVSSDRADEQRLDVKWGVWFKGRNTPQVEDAPPDGREEAIRKARKSGCAGHDQPVTSARPLKGASLKAANKGEWVRERSGGERSTSAGSYKYRPQLKKKAKGNKF